MEGPGVMLGPFFFLAPALLGITQTPASFDGLAPLGDSSCIC
jgi:hypothetical protein